MLQRGLSPPPLPWSVSMIIMQSSQHRYNTVSRLSGSSVYAVSAVPRRSVIPSGLSSLSRQSIPSSLQAYFSLSSLGSSLRVSLTSVVSADRRIRLEAHSILSPQQSRTTIDLGCTGVNTTTTLAVYYALSNADRHVTSCYTAKRQV